MQGSVNSSSFQIEAVGESAHMIMERDQWEGNVRRWALLVSNVKCLEDLGILKRRPDVLALLRPALHTGWCTSMGTQQPCLRLRYTILANNAGLRRWSKSLK